MFIAFIQANKDVLLSGLCAAIIVQGFVWLREARQEQKTQKKEATYLAVRVTCILDEYVNKCVEVVQDDGTDNMGFPLHTDKGQEHYPPTVKLPDPPQFPNDVDWKSIDADLMYRILTMPNTVNEANNYLKFIRSEYAHFPDYTEVHEARWGEYAKIGLEGIAIADVLRETYQLPDKDYTKRHDDWNPQGLFKEKIAIVEKRQKENEARAKELDKELSCC